MTETIKRSATFVQVGCKLPNGLILEMGGLPTDDTYQRVELNGSNKATLAGGYGLTQVPLDFWEAWIKLHAKKKFYRDQQVFAVGDAASAASRAQENAKRLTGLERLDPNAGTQNATGGQVEVDAEHRAAATNAVTNYAQAMRG